MAKQLPNDRNSPRKRRTLPLLSKIPKRSRTPPDSSTTRTRHLLALIVVFLFAFSLVAAIFEARATAISATLSQVVMLIIGYYFGKT